MSQRFRDKIEYCHQHVARCRELARRTNDPSLKSEYLMMEECWSQLAEGYALTASIFSFRWEP